jgi:hypothetical protein
MERYQNLDQAMNAWMDASPDLPPVDGDELPPA